MTNKRTPPVAALFCELLVFDNRDEQLPLTKHFPPRATALADSDPDPGPTNLYLSLAAASIAVC